MAVGLWFLPDWPNSMANWLQTDSRLIPAYCHFITIFTHPGCFEDTSWLCLAADPAPIFKATVLKATRLQVHCTCVKWFWSCRGLQPPFLLVSKQHCPLCDISHRVSFLLFPSLCFVLKLDTINADDEQKLEKLSDARKIFLNDQQINSWFRFSSNISGESVCVCHFSAFSCTRWQLEK